MGKRKKQSCTKRERQAEMGTRMESKRGKGEERGRTNGFTACVKLESSAPLKVPSHIFLLLPRMRKHDEATALSAVRPI